LPNIDEALFAIEKFESFYGSPEALRQSLPPEERDMNIIELWECYRDEKLKSTAIDFSDMISLCIRLLSESQDILEAYRQRYKHILIDEYQDTNIPQYKLSRLLAGKNHNLFIVGDDDQSIYRFRGADVGNILNFKRDYPNSSIIKLEINYRSAVHILALANNIFKSKPHDLRKTLRVNEDNSHPLFVEPEKIRIFRGKDTREEMEYIKQEMGRVMKFHGFNYSDFAILYRVNRQGDDIRHYLENYKIPWGEGGVVLSTLHGAKGLQYPVVFFVGMEERICPSYPRGKVGEQEFRACMDEEQRLFYVGVTRAQYMLYLTSLRKRMWYGREKRFEESRFLKLVPNNILYKRSFKSKLLEILLEEA
ncbi:MAG: UvrD-helicase domain-containing protein, partial [Elusimicrobiota bacterium]